jgi:predicted TPR repeat methyltransferase
MTSFSNDAKYVAMLQHIEQQIATLQLGQAAQALNALQKSNPADPRVYLLGSRMAHAAKNSKGELQLALRAHQAAPSWPVATIYLANVLAATGHSQDAMTVAAQAVQQSEGTTDRAELLVNAATLARQLGQYEQSLPWLRMALDLKPEDGAIRYKIARVLMETGNVLDAIGILDELLAAQPTLAPLLIARMEANLAAGKTEQAFLDAQALQATDPANEVYGVYIAVARGETPHQLPESLIRQLFAADADKFDQQMVVQNHYKLPRDVAKMIHTWHPDKTVDVLDLGCGTGLLGVCLRPIQGVLVGVDLSGEMIAQAQQHQVYDSFHQVNLLDALVATPADLYHVITALDVLNYVGELDSVMAGAFRILLPGGRFVFSCELDTQDSSDFKLHNTYRYTHRQSYVENLLQEAGYTDITLDKIVIRLEAGVPVPGLLATACKPLSPMQKPARKSSKSSKKTSPQA